LRHSRLSSEVFPEIKEYERVSTTVVNAYVRPVVGRYLHKLGERLKGAGYDGPVLIILSHGGVAPIDEAVRLAAATVLSGPAGGVAGARHGAALIGAENLVPFDMGGTSTDISMIVDGEPALSTTRGIAGQRIALQSLDIASIASGGGSIACVSDQRVPGQCRGRPVMEMVALRWRSLMQASCSAFLTRRIFLVDGRRWTRPPPKRR
jgi:N-methylhydantoinase A